MDIEKCWYKDVCNLDCYNSCIRFNSMISLCQKSNLSENNWIPKKLYANDRDRQAFKYLSTIKSDIVNFVENGNSLYLYSQNSGNGKTSWAIKLLLAYFDRVWHKKAFDCAGVFINTQSFIFKNKENISNPTKEFEELKQNILSSDLVIWDDIASARLSEYDYQLLLTFINTRKLNGKSNLYTGNCDQNGCNEFLGQRLSSRVWNDSIIIGLVEPDKRGENYD